MVPPNPSRQALQYLSRLCRSIEQPIVSTHARPSLRHSHVRAISTQPTRRNCKQQAQRNPTTLRPFSSTHRTSIQPSTSKNPDTDPQNTANPTLPDITNYYTLFPSTLPSGPPGPGLLEQTDRATPEDQATSEATFTIHLPTLRQEFLQLQSLHHPDKYPTGSSAHQKALALSALINNAYKTLSDPLLRAQYLLQLQYDVDVTNEDNSANQIDQGTLIEVMEAQERLEEAERQEEVDVVKDENTMRIAETELVMGKAFEEGDLDKAKEECVRLKYWRSLQGALHEWEPGKEVRLIH